MIAIVRMVPKARRWKPCLNVLQVSTSIAWSKAIEKPSLVGTSGRRAQDGTTRGYHSCEAKMQLT
eukprot:6203123-Pleurochrysis_carterae.AAC.2